MFKMKRSDDTPTFKFSASHTFITHGDYDSAYKTIFYLDTGFHGGDILYIPSVKVRVGSVSRTDVLTTLSLY